MSSSHSSFADVALILADGAVITDKADMLSGMDRAVLADCVDATLKQGAGTFFEAIEHPRDGACVLAFASLPAARSWKIALPPAIASGRDDCVVVCRISSASTRARIKAFCEAFGLTDAVARIVIALYETCDVEAAAKTAGIGYHTAREYLKQARAAIWAPNLQQLITWAAVGSLSIDPRSETDDILCLLFSLTNRQLQIAGMIADGASRELVARRLSISHALVKKELNTIYSATGVSSAVGLARLGAELRCLAMATGDSLPAQPHPPPFSRPLAINAPAARTIVAEDYGPVKGQPVLVLHNTMNCRGVDRALVDALHNRGYRPISPDRPGYGDTDAPSAHCTGDDYLDLCADDLRAIADHLGLTRVPVIAHGPVHVVLRLMKRHPDLVACAVIDAPEPDSSYGRRAQGMMASLKRQFARRPKAVGAMARILFSLASYDRFAAFLREWTASSPADNKAMSDPALMMDFYRKLEPFRRGKLDGLVREQLLQATMGKPDPIHGLSHVALLIGATDFMHDADENAAYWRDVLPDAKLSVIEDAGRFISYSHPEEVVAALDRLIGPR